MNAEPKPFFDIFTIILTIFLGIIILYPKNTQNLNQSLYGITSYKMSESKIFTNIVIGGDIIVQPEVDTFKPAFPYPREKRQTNIPATNSITNTNIFKTNNLINTNK